jgi:hypothetical protein
MAVSMAGISTTTQLATPNPIRAATATRAIMQPLRRVCEAGLGAEYQAGG